MANSWSLFFWETEPAFTVSLYGHPPLWPQNLIFHIHSLVQQIFHFNICSVATIILMVEMPHWDKVLSLQNLKHGICQLALNCLHLYLCLPRQVVKLTDGRYIICLILVCPAQYLVHDRFSYIWILTHTEWLYFTGGEKWNRAPEIKHCWSQRIWHSMCIFFDLQSVVCLNFS